MSNIEGVEERCAECGLQTIEYIDHDPKAKDETVYYCTNCNTRHEGIPDGTPIRDIVEIATFEGPGQYYELYVIRKDGESELYIEPQDNDTGETLFEGFGRWFSFEHDWEELQDG